MCFDDVFAVVLSGGLYALALRYVAFMSFKNLFSAQRMHVQMGFDSNWITTCVECLLTGL